MRSAPFIILKVDGKYFINDLFIYLQRETQSECVNLRADGHLLVCFPGAYKGLEGSKPQVWNSVPGPYMSNKEPNYLSQHPPVQDLH